MWYLCAGARRHKGGAAGAGGLRAALHCAEPPACGRQRQGSPGASSRLRPGTLDAGRARHAAPRVQLWARAARALLEELRRQRAGQGEQEVTYLTLYTFNSTITSRSGQLLYCYSTLRYKCVMMVITCEAEFQPEPKARA